jgi:hypothetical protein
VIYETRTWFRAIKRHPPFHLTIRPPDHHWLPPNALLYLLTEQQNREMAARGRRGLDGNVQMESAPSCGRVARLGPLQGWTLVRHIPLHPIFCSLLARHPE